MCTNEWMNEWMTSFPLLEVQFLCTIPYVCQDCGMWWLELLPSSFLMGPWELFLEHEHNNATLGIGIY